MKNTTWHWKLSVYWCNINISSKNQNHSPRPTFSSLFTAFNIQRMLKTKILNSFSRSLGPCIHMGWCQCIHMSKATVLRCPVENLSNSSFGSGYDWLIPLPHWRRCRPVYGPKSEIHLVRMTVDQGLFRTIKYGHTCMARYWSYLTVQNPAKLIGH
jgi:hypothetical protein